MVNALTGSNGLRGTLLLEDGALVFRPDTTRTSEKAFPLDQIKKARRVLGSPVLEIQLHAGEPSRVLGFYFTRPPSLEEPVGAPPLQPFRRHQVKRNALNSLRLANADKKKEVAGWVDRIRSAKAEGSA